MFSFIKYDNRAISIAVSGALVALSATLAVGGAPALSDNSVNSYNF